MKRRIGWKIRADGPTLDGVPAGGRHCSRASLPATPDLLTLLPGLFPGASMNNHGDFGGPTTAEPTTGDPPFNLSGCFLSISGDNTKWTFSGVVLDPENTWSSRDVLNFDFPTREGRDHAHGHDA
jgi:hypothetical protein